MLESSINPSLKTLYDCQNFVADYAPYLSTFAATHEHASLNEEGKEQGYYVNHYRKYEMDYLPIIVNMLQVLRPGQAVEIGPGWGTMCAWLIGNGWDVDAFDWVNKDQFITQAFVEELTARAHKDGRSFTIRFNSDIFDPLTAKDCGRWADLVLMTQVIPHLKYRPDLALRNAASLLDDNGILLTTVLDRVVYKNLEVTYKKWEDVPAFSPETAPCDDTVVCMYDEQEFKELLSTVFHSVNVWHPPESTCLFAVCRNPKEDT